MSVCTQICFKSKRINGWNESFDGIKRGARHWSILGNMASEDKEKEINVKSLQILNSIIIQDKTSAAKISQCNFPCQRNCAIEEGFVWFSIFLWVIANLGALLSKSVFIFSGSGPNALHGCKIEFNSFFTDTVWIGKLEKIFSPISYNVIPNLTFRMEIMDWQRMALRRLDAEKAFDKEYKQIK